MAKASPAQNVFEGEFSPLAAARTDIERYGRGMRYMLNSVACALGPAIGRSGTYFENRCAEPGYPSKLLPFDYNEDEAVLLEFSHYKLRFFYEYNGVAAHREKAVASIISFAPFSFTAPGHDVVIGESVVFSGFPAQYNVNGVIAKVTNVVGDGIYTDWNGDIGPGLSGSPVMAVVYEVVTPWSRDDVQYLQLVQELNICYLFSGDAPAARAPYVLKRLDTFSWTLELMELKDGPFMDINTEATYLEPLTKGSWVPDMTGPTAPSGEASASSETSGHEAWKAFDGDIDSYWESNESQEGWLQYKFTTDFHNDLNNFSGYTSGAQTISAQSESAGDQAWKASDQDGNTDWRSSGTLPQWWMVDLGSAQTVRAYIIGASKNKEEFAPKDWTLEGAASGAGPWTVLDTRTGIKWESGQDFQYAVQAPAAFRYYRIVTTKVNRKTLTEIIPSSGRKGKKDYVPEQTVTTKSDNRAGFRTVKLTYGQGTLRTVNGYTIFLGRKSKGKDTKSHAPRTWYFEGHDGNKWQLLDSRQGYDNWHEYRSKFFDIKNAQAYERYRIRIKEANEEGDINPRIGKLTFSSPDAPPVTLRASSKVGINEDRGFLSTDVGRQLRFKDADNTWRWGTITAVTNETDITVTVGGNDPLVLTENIKFWRLGLWSDTTGWPTCGVLHEDRLWAAGASGFPDHIVASRTGQHTNFEHVGSDDVVLDDHGVVARCNSRYMSEIVWLKASEEALRIGTGKNEFIISTPSDEPLSPRNIYIRQTTRRGSMAHEPAVIDTDIVFVHKSGRALYANTYSLGSSGDSAAYSSTLMSKLGQHLLYPPLEHIVYQQEPHSIIWGIRSDHSVIAMTYSNDEDVFGGHRHDFGDGVHELCVLASPTDRQDSLWLVVNRKIAGVDQYCIERLFRFWDFGDILAEDATFVDSALRYYGNVATDRIYGLRHLAGRRVNVLADNIPYKNLGPVSSAGELWLVRPAYWVVVGVPMVTEAEINAPDVGAEDGTAQGKSKRPHSVVLSLWETARGEVGRWDEDHGVVQWTPIEYKYPQDANVPEVVLRTCQTNATVLPGGYGTLGTVRWRQTEPLPLNVVACYPQQYTEDER